jgi:glycosyltransferase involved in cell wall biosynthesis
MKVPSFSVVVETANLSLADLDGLRETLASLAAQSLPIQGANEVLLADSGDVPEETLQRSLTAFPWVRRMRLPDGTGYEELKMAGARASTGDVVVFADGDCLYPHGWLEALLSPFSDPAVFIVGGETTIEASGAYGLAVAIASSFPARSSAPGLYVSDRYHLNNVAFRRSVLEHVPIPSRRPCYRMSGLHAAGLLAAGYTILRQPAARAGHAAPNGLTHFIWRFILMGFDGVVVPRLIAAEGRSAGSRGGQWARTVALMRFWATQAAAKLRDAVRASPSRVISLPLAAPILAGAVLLQAFGALAGLVAPRRLLAAVPGEILSSSTCELQRTSSRPSRTATGTRRDRPAPSKHVP